MSMYKKHIERLEHLRKYSAGAVSDVSARETLLLSERAAARAEGAREQYEQDMVEFRDRHNRCASAENKARDLSTELSAAKAEIERLRDRLAFAREDGFNHGVRAAHDNSASWVELSTKLSNLRAAAERYRRHEISDHDFDAAIEASR
jgi:predicted RNase H-like nuclease (RuvC/YqgF family)